jgi:hypothetical protein
MAKWDTDKLDAALSPVAGKVKPLEWGAYSNPVFAGPDIALARVDGIVTCFYQVQRDPWGPGYMAYAYPEHGSECWNSKGHPTLEAAKAAAQADYEARILSALSPTPSPDAVVKAALERAAGDAKGRILTLSDGFSLRTANDVADTIRALANDPEARAAIIEAAKGME